MLDTDISRYIIKKRLASLLERFERHAERLCVSVITAAELQSGAEKAGGPALISLVQEFLERLAVLDWTQVVGHYARICAALEKNGKPIGNMDFLIAFPRGLGGVCGRYKQPQALLPRAGVEG